MAEQGHLAYQLKIRRLKDEIAETVGDAGRYWQFCPFTMAKIQQIRLEIAETEQHALDRFEDWASD